MVHSHLKAPNLGAAVRVISAILQAAIGMETILVIVMPAAAIPIPVLRETILRETILRETILREAIL
jgi:hypothetical protein